MTIKVEVYKDKMVLRSSKNSVTIKPETSYVTTRLLVGTFQPAVVCLKSGLEQLGAFGFFTSKPTLTIYPKELVEGGLSEVEERCLMEMGYSAGAKKVEVKL